jgi:tRNA uridine 5-carboxymethylaminomethyl modification enzyme
VKQEAPLILDRTEAYTAILIDDLISKGTNEPYRMFTSRAEFRLHLRIDNADRRLTPHGRRIGLISDIAWADFQQKQERMKAMKRLLESTKITGSLLEKLSGVLPLKTSVAANPNGTAVAESIDLTSLIGQTCAQSLKRPEVSIEWLVPVLRDLDPAYFSRPPAVNFQNSLPVEIRNELKSVETEIKYEGYLLQQNRAIERLKKSEQRAIPSWFDYKSVSGLSREMQEKLSHVLPSTLGQASRIPGVTPAAVSLVNVYIEIQAKRRGTAESSIQKA